MTTNTKIHTDDELRALQQAYKDQKPQRKGAIAARNKEMIRLRFVEGLTLQAIGTRYGLTRQRVEQIVNTPL